MARNAVHEVTETETETVTVPETETEVLRKFPQVYMPVSTEKRGHFQRLPEPFWYQVVVERFGSVAATNVLDAWRGHCLRVAQSACKAKNVDDSLAAEREAAANALAKLANGTYESAVDRNPNSAFAKWVREQITAKFGAEKAKPKIVSATLAVKGDELITRAEFVPTKKNARAADDDGDEGDALDL